MGTDGQGDNEWGGALCRGWGSGSLLLRSSLEAGSPTFLFSMKKVWSLLEPRSPVAQLYPVVVFQTTYRHDGGGVVLRARVTEGGGGVKIRSAREFNGHCCNSLGQQAGTITRSGIVANIADYATRRRERAKGRGEKRPRSSMCLLPLDVSDSVAPAQRCVIISRLRY